jgi:predicted hexulose-6-phosphate isomerase
MNEFCLGLYEKSMPNTLLLEEKLEETKRAGFDYLELSIDETDEKLARLEWTTAERMELQRAMGETGVKVLSICLSGNRKYPLGSEDESVRERGVEIMRDAIDLAQDLGIRIIQIAGYDEYYGESNDRTRALFGENLERMVRHAATRGVILAFETMETEFMNTVGKAMEYVRAFNSPYLQIYPDIGNVANAALAYGTDPFQDLESGRGHLAAVHMKETVPGKFREIPYGTGHVDFQKNFQLAADMGVGLFVGEFWHVGNDDWREQLAFANRFLRERME